MYVQGEPQSASTLNGNAGFASGVLETKVYVTLSLVSNTAMKVILSISSTLYCILVVIGVPASSVQCRKVVQHGSFTMASIGIVLPQFSMKTSSVPVPSALITVRVQTLSVRKFIVTSISAQAGLIVTLFPMIVRVEFVRSVTAVRLAK